MIKPVAATRKEATRERRRQRRHLSVLGVLGEVLITAGVVVFLFLGWQLWLNDIIVGGQDNHAAADVAKSWDSGNSSTHDEQSTPDFGEPMVLTKPKENSTFAVLYAPRFGDGWVREIAEGVGMRTVLNKGKIGHYPATQLPGEMGNVALAAHRLAYGAPFRDIDQLRVGDKLYLKTKDGYYTYVFRNLEYVGPRGVGVLEPVPQLEAQSATDRILTIMSCNPKYSVAERLIAYAVFDSWQPISAGPPAEIATLANAKG